MRRRNPTSGCSATRCAATPAQFAREDGVEETWRIDAAAAGRAATRCRRMRPGRRGEARPRRTNRRRVHPGLARSWLRVHRVPAASRSSTWPTWSASVHELRDPCSRRRCSGRRRPAPPRTVGELVAMAHRCSASATAPARTCLWRMVSNGELTSDGGTYAARGACSNERQRVDEASDRQPRSAVGWHVGAGGRLAGTLGRRPIGLRCAKPQRRCTSPNYGKAFGSARTTSTRTACRRCAPVLDLQCVHFHDARDRHHPRRR